MIILAVITLYSFQLGSLYTLIVAGERMTFILDPADFHHFFLSANVDFQKAVQAPVKRVGEHLKGGMIKSEESMWTFHKCVILGRYQ